MAFYDLHKLYTILHYDSAIFQNNCTAIVHLQLTEVWVVNTSIRKPTGE